MTTPAPPTPESPQPQYRQALYAKYSSLTGSIGKPRRDDADDALYDRYLRGWLPDDPDAAILDAGCGTGRLLAFLRRRGYSQISGVDLSPQQVELARKAQLPVEQGDVLEYLAERPAAFDFITAMDLVEHLSRDEILRFIELARQALRPGGTLIVQTPNPDSPFFGSVRYGDLTHEIALAPRVMCALLRAGGFGECRLREAAPVAWGYSIKSTVRWALWQCLRFGIGFCNIVETGSPGSGVYTRVYLTRTTNPAETKEP